MAAPTEMVRENSDPDESAELSRSPQFSRFQVFPSRQSFKIEEARTGVHQSFDIHYFNLQDIPPSTTRDVEDIIATKYKLSENPCVFIILSVDPVLKDAIVRRLVGELVLPHELLVYYETHEPFTSETNGTLVLTKNLSITKGMYFPVFENPIRDPDFKMTGITVLKIDGSCFLVINNIPRDAVNSEHHSVLSTILGSLSDSHAIYAGCMQTIPEKMSEFSITTQQLDIGDRIYVHHATSQPPLTVSATDLRKEDGSVLLPHKYLTLSLPGMPSTDVFRKFLDKPDIGILRGSSLDKIDELMIKQNEYLVGLRMNLTCDGTLYGGKRYRKTKNKKHRKTKNKKHRKTKNKKHRHTRRF